MSREQTELLKQLALDEPRLLERWQEMLTNSSYRGWLQRSITRCGGCGSADVLVLSHGGTISVSCARRVGVMVENPRTGKRKKEPMLQPCGWRVKF